MALLQNTAESGLANGTDVTVANSGGGAGDAFTTVSGTAFTYESAAAIRGSLGFLVNVAASATTYRAWQSVAGASTACAVRAGFYFPSFTANAQSLVNIRSSGGGTSLFHLMVNSTGTLSILSDVSSTTLGTTAAALSTATNYRIEFGVTNPTTTTGTVTLRAYTWGTNTVVASLDLTGVNLGAAVAMGACRFGRPAAIGSAYTYRLDDVAFQTGSATLIGPPAAGNVAPSAGADQTNVEPGSTVTITATDTDGTIASIVQTAGSPTVTLSGSGGSRTFTAPLTLAGTTLTFQVTDNGGLTDDMTVTVLPAAERIMLAGTWVAARFRTL